MDFLTIENLAVLLSIGFVVFNARGKIISWPLGILGSSIYSYIFFDVRLYGDVILQFVYVAMGLYGWWQWHFSPHIEKELEALNIQRKQLLLIFVIGLITIPLFGFILDEFTDSDSPYWDAYSTVFSLIATWMMARRYIENWLVWIVVDSSCIFIYLYKELYSTTFLFFIYTIMAIYGYFNWKKQFLNEKST